MCFLKPAAEGGIVASFRRIKQEKTLESAAIREKNAGNAQLQAAGTQRSLFHVSPPLTMCCLI